MFSWLNSLDCYLLGVWLCLALRGCFAKVIADNHLT